MALCSPPDVVPVADTAQASTMEAALRPEATPKPQRGARRRNTQQAIHPMRNKAGSPAMARNPSTSRSIGGFLLFGLSWGLDQGEGLALAADHRGHPAEGGVGGLANDGGAELGSLGG